MMLTRVVKQKQQKVYVSGVNDVMKNNYSKQFHKKNRKYKGSINFLEYKKK